MGSILASLGINGTFVLEIVNFIILFIVLRLFAWPPLVKAMEQRRRGIEEQLFAAQNEREEAVRIREVQNRELGEARVQAREIVERAQRVASEEARQVVEEARAQAERLQKQVREEIARERDAAVATLRGEMGNLVVEVAGKLLRARVDSAEDRRLADEFIAAARSVEAGGAR